ncbi:hypothetical protein GBA52_019662 [Prunus armeniaca]|nr:hypothetical protein GBA52_019662 [Prunus armeniaca]
MEFENSFVKPVVSGDIELVTNDVFGYGYTPFCMVRCYDLKQHRVKEELTTACFQKWTALGKLSTRYRTCSVKPTGQVVGDLMTPAPVVVSETTNLEDVARLLLETKYRRLPVVDDSGKLVRDALVSLDLSFAVAIILFLYL